MISVEYTMAIAEARKLEQAAESCGEALTLINQEITNSSGFWVGNSGDAMRSRLQESYRLITKIKSEYETIARNIRSAAETIKEKDVSIAGQVASALGSLFK